MEGEKDKENNEERESVCVCVFGNKSSNDNVIKNNLTKENLSSM